MMSANQDKKSREAKDNPDYLYLTRIIRAVNEALFSTMRIEEKEEHGLSQ